MPQFDRTGPRGQGPMTGRGLGECRFRSPNAPFRGTINEQDIRKIVSEEISKQKKFVK